MKKYAGGEETTSKDILPHGRGGGALTTNAMQCSVPFLRLVPFDIGFFYGKSKPDSLHSGDSARLGGRHTHTHTHTGICLHRTYYE